MMIPDPPTKRQAEWRKLRSSVLMRDGSRCRYCDARNAVLIDRVGGGMGEDAFVTCCGPCLDVANPLRGDVEAKRAMVRTARHLDDAPTSILSWNDRENRDAHKTRRELRAERKAEATQRAWQRRQRRAM